jgi:hypothetical protein
MRIVRGPSLLSSLQLTLNGATATETAELTLMKLVLVDEPAALVAVMANEYGRVRGVAPLASQVSVMLFSTRDTVAPVASVVSDTSVSVTLLATVNVSESACRCGSVVLKLGTEGAEKISEQSAPP